MSYDDVFKLYQNGELQNQPPERLPGLLQAASQGLGASTMSPIMAEICQQIRAQIAAHEAKREHRKIYIWAVVAGVAAVIGAVASIASLFKP